MASSHSVQELSPFGKRTFTVWWKHFRFTVVGSLSTSGAFEISLFLIEVTSRRKFWLYLLNGWGGGKGRSRGDERGRENTEERGEHGVSLRRTGSSSCCCCCCICCCWDGMFCKYKSRKPWNSKMGRPSSPVAAVLYFFLKQCQPVFQPVEF